MSYFSLFNIAEQYNVDIQQLSRTYQRLQKMTHPDQVSNASEQQKRLYMQKNTQVNDAYEVLKDPIKRGEHLLKLRGVILPNEQETLGDVDFLMTQMSLREALHTAEDEEQLTLLLSSTQKQVSERITRINDLFNQENTSSNKEAAEELTKLKFLVKLQTETETKLDTLLDDE